MPSRSVAVDTKCPNRAARDLPLFRARAVAASRLRWFGPVTVMTPPTWRVAAIVAITAVAMLVVAGTTIEIPDRIPTTGMLLPATGLLKIKSPRAGRIQEVMVRDGEQVGGGQPMLRISGVHNAPGHQPELSERIASLHRELEGIESGAREEIRAVQYRIRRNRDRLRLVNVQIETAAAELETREAQASLENTSAKRLNRLAASKAIATQVVDAAKTDALHATAAVQVARRLLLELEEKRLLIELQLNDDRSQVAVLRSRTEGRREEIARQIAAGRLQSEIELVAPISGIVSGITVASGEVIAAGEVLATMHDPSSPLEARLYLLASDFGRIAAGQRVELALPAYPRETYGTLSAVIASVSSAAVPANEIEPGLSYAGPVFEIRASLDDTEVLTGAGAWSLPAGASVNAHIVRQRWPLFRWLWRSVTGGNLGS